MSLPAADADFGFPVLQITRNEYASLVKSAQHRALQDTLCRNLLNGGVPRETIEVEYSFSAPNPLRMPTSPALSNIVLQTLQIAFAALGMTPQLRRAEAAMRGRDGTKFNASGSASNSSTTSDNDSLGADDGPSGALLAPTSKPTVAPTATRTVQLLHLAEGTTIADVTTVVRGGLLVNIYSRARQNSVALSFLHSSDAHAFYHHVQANGLYIKNSKVDVRWDDRQFVVAGHVAHKIALGACRNLVIRDCKPNLSEQEIRNDLEHIHSLVVVQIQFIGGHCFISTNSVAAAMFARTCMMSRLKYKGTSRIEWGVDECAQPLHTMSVRTQKLVASAAARGTISSTSNRFQLLSLDE
ncbi:hypothetical protein ED733_006075 [Metarhizium rileyi]|uniref:Uncharacterized protein n=1 Tax=Metarhizium rileyi (strain RCEF 4871) TaxID=1649241 RepID=A0A5C6GBP9_METRR|nr:hypothetical protein ED733_006075 [Metarhizium rileyi]